MMANSLIDIMEEWTLWSINIAKRPIIEHELTQGLTNKSYLLNTGQERWVLRINNHNDEALGLDRDEELYFHTAAARQGIAPDVVYADPSNNYLVVEFIEGGHWQASPNSQQRKQDIHAIVEALHDVHHFPIDMLSIDYLARAEHYWNKMDYGNSEFTQILEPLYPQLRSFFVQYQDAIKRRTPCHHDTVIENIFVRPEGIQLIDWEYATLGDPWFDIAVFCDSAKLNQQEQDEVVAHYSDLQGSHEKCREAFYRAQQGFYYLDLLWHCVQRYSIDILSAKLLRLNSHNGRI
jgi:thiamine kinase